MFLNALTAILTLIAGIGIFLVACQMMSSNLETASSSRLKSLFSKVSNSRLIGVGIGALGTAAIQSSGATTVMVIGFVNVGIMSLAQAATVIYGANIGTTVTALIVAMGLSGGGGISTTTIFAALTGIGALIGLFSKNDNAKTWGGIITGFGMLFVGLSIMESSMKSFAEMEEVRLYLAGVDNALLLVMLGAVLTAIIQSSSVVTSIAITMVVTGLITLNQGIFLTMGSNIGSCVVAIIAGMTSGTNAKRTALIHLFFNCFGVIVFMCAAGIMYLASSGTFGFGTIFEDLFPGVPQFQLALFHTFFNVTTVLIILPLTDYLVRLVCHIIPDSRDAANGQAAQPHFYFVDDKMLRTPIIAVHQVQLEIEHMAAVAMHNYDIAIYTISRLDFCQMDEFRANEAQLNYLNRSLIPYIVRLNNLPVSEEDHRYLATAIRSVGDLERIGDYAVNITEYAEDLHKSGEAFTGETLDEIEQMREAIFSVYQFVMKAYMEKDFKALDEANAHEDEVDNLTENMEKQHLRRLTDGVYSANVGAQYQELASDSERIADHLINVGKSIRTLSRN